jgi:pre-rRNA-processing protein TSR3
MCIDNDDYLPTLIWRHRKERISKCSLRGLEGRGDLNFFRYPTESLPDLSNYILLTLNAPPLTQDDAQQGLLLLDATWRYANKMLAQLNWIPQSQRRSLPNYFVTAYPRRQFDCAEPDAGLASIEALVAAYHILGRETTGLLDHYHWADLFLERNAARW